MTPSEELAVLQDFSFSCRMMRPASDKPPEGLSEAGREIAFSCLGMVGRVRKLQEQVPGRCDNCRNWRVTVGDPDGYCIDNDSFDFPRDGSGFCSKFKVKP